MRKGILLLIMFIDAYAYAQVISKNDMVQIPYVSCKTEKYFAFQQFNVGVELCNSLQFGRAKNKFENAIEKDSTYCDAWYMLAFCNQKQDKLDEAIVACNKSITLNDSNVSAYTIRAYTMLMKGDTVNAIADFHNAKKLDPLKIDSYYGLALIYYHQKQMKEALTQIENYEQKNDDTAAWAYKRKLKKLKEKILEK